jgi:hypothetical protein
MTGSLSIADESAVSPAWQLDDARRTTGLAGRLC